jgi:hypothetical protein
MYWLFLDETNTSPEAGPFFIYGGLAIRSEKLPDVHHMISDVRTEYGFSDTDQFKFSTRTRPEAMPVESWREAKSQALERAHSIGVDLIVYAVHHQIARKEYAQTYALNQLISSFDKIYLERVDDFGAVCIDRVEEDFGFKYFRETFRTPFTYPSGWQSKADRVIHYSMSCDGASHINSLVDLAIGGMRYCMNAAMGNGKDEVAEQIMRSLAKLLWAPRERNGKRYLLDYGLILRPQNVEVPAYREDYKRLIEKLSEYLKSDISFDGAPI